MNPPPRHSHFYSQPLNVYSQLPISNPQISNPVVSYSAQQQIHSSQKESSQIYTQVYYNLNKNFKVSDLKELCKKLFLQKQGRRCQLIEQLATFLTANKESLAIKTNLTDKQREILFAPTPIPEMNYTHLASTSVVRQNGFVAHYPRPASLPSSYLGNASSLRAQPQIVKRPEAPPRFPYNETYLIKCKNPLPIELQPDNIEKTARDVYYFLYNKQPLAIESQDAKYQCICENQAPMRGSVFRLQCRLCKNYSHSLCYGINQPYSTAYSEFECALCIGARVNPLLLPLFREPGSNDLFSFLCFKPHKQPSQNRTISSNKKHFKISEQLMREIRKDNLVVQVRIVKIGPKSACFPKLQPQLQDCYEIETPWCFQFDLNDQHHFDGKTDPGQYAKKKSYELYDFIKHLKGANSLNFRYWPFYQNENDEKPKDDFEVAVIVMLFMKAPKDVIREQTYSKFTGDHTNPIFKDEENDELVVEGETIDLLCPYNRQIMKIPS